VEVKISLDLLEALDLLEELLGLQVVVLERFLERGE
jgi:hypothetical protein